MNHSDEFTASISSLFTANRNGYLPVPSTISPGDTEISNTATEWYNREIGMGHTSKAVRTGLGEY